MYKQLQTDDFKQQLEHSSAVNKAVDLNIDVEHINNNSDSVF